MARKRQRSDGLYPPNPTQWENETNGLKLREELEIPLNVALPCDEAFRLLPGVQVCAPGDIPLAAKFVRCLRGEGRSMWSGIAVPLPEGGALVVYNDRHSQNRIRATLMEEFFHLRLGHPPSVIRVYDGVGKLRTHDGSIESVAYGSGTAALVPYKALRQFVDDGMSSSMIADRLSVSIDLVRFRAKVTKLYSTLFPRKRQ